jgi:plastocyanin
MTFTFPGRHPRTAAAVIACGLFLCAGAPAWAKEHKVSIDNIKYEPKEIKIKKGDTVVWANSDDRDHTVTADDGSFASKKLASRDTYERKFAKAGKFKYHCDYHPRMKATVVVED